MKKILLQNFEISCTALFKSTHETDYILITYAIQLKCIMRFDSIQ